MALDNWENNFGIRLKLDRSRYQCHLESEASKPIAAASFLQQSAAIQYTVLQFQISRTLVI